MNSRLPAMAVALGVAGLIPFIGCGVAAVATSDNQAIPALFALIAYGAVILSFIGGADWGFVLAPRPLAIATDPAAIRSGRDNLRLVVGVAPSLIGWAALVIAQLVSPDVGLALLVAAFVAATAVEWKLFRDDLFPPGYMWLRWGLTVVVLLTLVTVLTLHLLGAKIIL